MIMPEKKHKLPYKNGERALNKLLGGTPPAARVESDEELKPWIQTDAVTVGIQGRDGFRALQNMTILTLSREYRRRFAALGGSEFCEAVASIRVIMLCRAKTNSSGCPFTVEIIQPRGDLCVTVDEDFGDDFLEDPRALQRQLDDACARFAECLGV